MTEAIRISQRDGLGISPNRALAAAHADAMKSYRDLSPYRIHLSLEEDGWHVDYELRSEKLKGGGPHYVIDPRDGEIINKRYQQ
jgi:hypothetical protein